MQNAIIQHPYTPYYGEPEDAPIYKVASCIPVVGTIISVVCRLGLISKVAIENLPPAQLLHIHKLVADYTLVDLFGLALCSISIIVLIAANVFSLHWGLVWLGCNLALMAMELPIFIEVEKECQRLRLL